MNIDVDELVDQQRRGLAELVKNLRKSRIEAARTAAREAATRIKALNGRVRAVARSGVRLTAVSQGAAQSLIELHAEIVNSAITDAAAQIERMAYTESVRDLARMQAEVLQATRQRIIEDITRTMTILKGAAGDARKVVAPAKPAGPAKAVRRRARRPAVKAAAARPASRKKPARARVKRKTRTRRSR